MSREPPPDAAAAAEARLREVVREAHGAVKDLERLLRDVREARREVVNDARAAAQEAAAGELVRFNAHLQREANELARQLNTAVRTAQQQVVKQLTVSDVEEAPDGTLRVKFAGALFDEDPHGDDPGPPGRERMTREKARATLEPLISTVAAPCPYCGKPNDAVTPLKPGDIPSPGDATVCFSCGELAVFTGEGFAVRRPSDAELVSLNREPVILKLRATWAVINSLPSEKAGAS